MSLKSTYNIDEKTKKVRDKFFNKYGPLPLPYRIQIRQRWLGAPYLQLANFVPKRGKILDLGCGLGNFSHVLCLTGNRRRVVGIDFDKKRIELAQKTVTKNENLVFRCADLRSMSFEKSDGVVLFDVLHHIDYNFHKGLLARIFQALKKGGVLLMIESEDHPKWKYFIWRVWELVALGLSITRGGSLSLRSRKDLKRMLKKIGFKTKAISYHQGRLFPHLLYICRKT